MAKRTLPLVVGAMFEIAGVPSGTITSLIETFQDRRNAKTRAILMEEIGSGLLHPSDFASADDVVQIAYRFQRMAERGTAFHNLRLLARVVRGLGKHPPIYATDFAKYERLLSDLRREEIFVISELYVRQGHRAINPDGSNVSQAWHAAVQSLVPSTFPSEDHFRAWASSAQRSGLLIPGKTIDDIDQMVPSPLLNEVMDLVSFEDLLADTEE